MIICGLKLTHDGAIALIDNGRLIFSIEAEKIGNAPRYAPLNMDLDKISSILEKNGYSLSQIDRFVIDGWGNTEDPKDETKTDRYNLAESGSELKDAFFVAKYGHVVEAKEDILTPSSFNSDPEGFEYHSYQHVAGHVCGTYCTSTFAKQRQASWVMVWDGGMPPQLFHFDPETNQVTSEGYLFPIMGHVYQLFPAQFPPYDHLSHTDMSIAGKFMAYIAKGKKDENIIREYRKILLEVTSSLGNIRLKPDFLNVITRQIVTKMVAVCKEKGYPSDDCLTSFHFFLEELILEELEKKLKQSAHETKNICLAGGCALNIKWNSSIRSSGLFENVWVPPFPNDSGSALGTACCEMIQSKGIIALDWDVYSGPQLEDPLPYNGWKSISLNPQQLALLLHQLDEPVAFINGRAELGPRALGNRSIIAAPVSGDMKTRLNEIKFREPYRPVAPICLEEPAESIFDPGTPDPYMLYDHKVRENWINKIPAVLHLDGTARLQTINARQNKEMHEVLTAYYELSGIPLLCNTSANFSGKGFFPDAQSAMEWGRTPFVWSDHTLYYKETRSDEVEQLVESTLRASVVF